MEGLSGMVRSQHVEGGNLRLALDEGEVLIAPWPQPGPAPRVVGQRLSAVVDIHPEGPAQRVEIGRASEPARLVLAARAYPLARIAGAYRIGRVTREPGSRVRVPVQDGERVVARLVPGETVVLQVDGSSWCLGILAATLPEPPLGQPREVADAPVSPRVDFVTWRLQGESDRCGATLR
jgi:hypothetical protein